jgi:TonB family protein
VSTTRKPAREIERDREREPTRAGDRKAGAASRAPRKRSVAFWLAVALLAHAEVALVLGVALYWLAPRDADLQRELVSRNGESIDVGMVDEDAARQILADLESEQEKQKAEEVQKEIDSIKAPGQVVDLPAPREEKRPDDARYAGEHDSTVEHETKKLGKFDEKARLGDASGQAAESHRARPASPADERLAMREPNLGRALKMIGPASSTPAPARPSGSAYGVNDPGEHAPDGAFGQLGANEQPQPGGAGAPAGGSPSLMPTREQLARVIGGGTQDALKDVDDGEETALNSKKWRFASFFNRVKKQVSEHWHPEEAYRRRDPTGAVYGRQNRYTELRIQLKPDGRLANVGVDLPSGLEFLDEEAIQAFRDAQPFPNPPRQLLESNGVINFRFGFLYDLNGPPQMRWFKYNN